MLQVSVHEEKFKVELTRPLVSVRQVQTSVRGVLDNGDRTFHLAGNRRDDILVC